MPKPTIHFVYTVPLGVTWLRRGLDKALRLAHLPPLHRWGNDRLISWRRPNRAPHSISYNLLHALKKKAPVRFYSMYEHGAITLGPNDIFIGQPLPQGGFAYNQRPKMDDTESITSATLRFYQGSSHRKFLIMPYADDSLLVSWAKDLAKNYASHIILIGGEIWTKNWRSTPFGDIDPSKTVRVDMGINLVDYPQVKTRFNPPGRRKYLYIGHDAWYKNTRELEKIAAVLPGFVGGHIGGGQVRGWKKLANFAPLTPAFMSKLAEEYDIFVNTSTADAQATTILEQMCFGLVVACTPESGYDHHSLVKLSTHDTKFNIKVLQELQYADEDKLLALTKQNRQIAATEHTWEKFCRTVTDFMGI